jgi:hypothetical protein
MLRDVIIAGLQCYVDGMLRDQYNVDLATTVSFVSISKRIFISRCGLVEHPILLFLIVDLFNLTWDIHITLEKK